MAPSPRAPHTPSTPSWVRAKVHKASHGLCAWLCVPARKGGHSHPSMQAKSQGLGHSSQPTSPPPPPPAASLLQKEQRPLSLSPHPSLPALRRTQPFAGRTKSESPSQRRSLSFPTSGAARGLGPSEGSLPGRAAAAPSGERAGTRAQAGEPAAERRGQTLCGRRSLTVSGPGRGAAVPAEPGAALNSPRPRLPPGSAPPQAASGPTRPRQWS